MPAGLEVCIDSVWSALEAEAGGATRLELCDALVEGGLTPSIGKVRVAVGRTRLPVHVMVRPRAGDFLYDESELAVMLADIREVKRAGAAGVVLGVLTSDGRVDEPRLQALVREASPLPVTFHRAIDVCRDPVGAIEALVRAGVARVLSSGGAPTATEGADTLQRMVDVAGGRLVVAAGGGVTEDNAGALVRATGVDEVCMHVYEPRAQPTRGTHVLCCGGAARTRGGVPSLPAPPRQVHGTLRCSSESGMAYRPHPPVYMGGEQRNTPGSEFELRAATRERVFATCASLRGRLGPPGAHATVLGTDATAPGAHATAPGADATAPGTDAAAPALKRPRREEPNEEPSPDRPTTRHRPHQPSLEATGTLRPPPDHAHAPATGLGSSELQPQPQPQPKPQPQPQPELAREGAMARRGLLLGVDLGGTSIKAPPNLTQPRPASPTFAQPRPTSRHPHEHQGEPLATSLSTPSTPSPRPHPTPPSHAPPWKPGTPHHPSPAPPTTLARHHPPP